MASAAPGATQVYSTLENEDNMMFPLSDMALVTFLKSVSGAAVAGITILNVYSATLVFTCAKNSTNIVMKAILVGLPFSILPILFIILNIVKMTEQSGSGLGVAASLVLCEINYIYVLGGVTTVLMTEASKIAVASVTAVLIGTVIKLWARFSRHPKCLSVLNSCPLDVENCLTVVSKAKVEKQELVLKDATQADLIKKSLNTYFVLYLIFCIGFMLVLVIVAEKWWHALLGIVSMSPIHILGLYLTTYLRDGLTMVCDMGPPNAVRDYDVVCNLPEKM